MNFLSLASLRGRGPDPDAPHEATGQGRGCSRARPVEERLLGETLWLQERNGMFGALNPANYLIPHLAPGAQAAEKKHLPI